MVKVLELPIYDPAGLTPPPTKSFSPRNIEIVCRDGPRYILEPIAEHAKRITNHLTSNTGIAQLLTIGGSVIGGRQLARRVLPMVKTREYTASFKAAHYTVCGALPLAVSCAWFETPRQLTLTAARFTGDSLLFIGYWSVYSLWYITSFTVSAIWTVIRGIIWDVPFFFIYNAGSIVWTIANSLVTFAIKDRKVAKEIPKPLGVESAPEHEGNDAVNPSDVEKELVKLKRHGAEETLITVVGMNKQEKTKLELIDDLGQSEEDDKDLFPSRPR